MNVLRERFIEKAIKKHGDLYDYSNIDYVNGKTKIILNCKEHGDFTITPAYHLQGGICPMCAKQRMLLALKRPKSEEQKRKRRETMLARSANIVVKGILISAIFILNLEIFLLNLMLIGCMADIGLI